MKTCENCKYCLEADDGYSNYTVEGTTAYCLLNLNPGMPIDRFYGEEPALNYAEQCERFAEGEGPRIDVEREDLADSRDKLSTAYTDDPEIKVLLDAWEEE